MGFLFRDGAEKRILTKLLKDNHIDTIIGLASNYSIRHVFPFAS